MVNLEQLSSWLVVVIFLVGVSVLLTRQWRHSLGDRLDQLTTWAAARAKPDPEFDDDPDASAEVREIMRTEKLWADVERLQRLLATDSGMSATRQIGNRIAYERLLQDVARLSTQPALVGSAGASSSDVVSSYAHREHSQCGPETIELRWRP